MSEFVTFFILAVLVEGIVRYLTAPLGDAVPGAAKMYGAMVLGIALCLLYNVDLLPALGLPAAVAWGAWAGPILTGIIIGSGSNALHDILDAIRARQLRAAPAFAVATLRSIERGDRGAGEPPGE